MCTCASPTHLLLYISANIFTFACSLGEAVESKISCWTVINLLCSQTRSRGYSNKGYCTVHKRLQSSESFLFNNTVYTMVSVNRLMHWQESISIMVIPRGMPCRGKRVCLSRSLSFGYHILVKYSIRDKHGWIKIYRYTDYTVCYVNYMYILPTFVCTWL